MKVVSLFDGISCARVALDRLGVKDLTYYASEVDGPARYISYKNYPDIIQLGDVRLVHKTDKHGVALDVPHRDLKCPDLLIGGSPCQDLSIAKKNREGLKGDRSGLFFEFVRLRDELKPRYWVLENVNSMPKEARAQISEILGVQPIMINAALVSAQNRKRLFWTNIPGVTLPADRGILLKDILESGDVDRLKSYAIDANYSKGGSPEYLRKRYEERGIRQIVVEGAAKRNRGEGKQVELNHQEKANAMTTVQTDSMVVASPLDRLKYLKGAKKERRVKDGHEYTFSEGALKLVQTEKSLPILASGAASLSRTANFVDPEGYVRKLTPIECERLQSLPDNYTDGISTSQRYRACGNAFNVEVVRHILSFIPGINEDRL